ncbi:MAG: hypothetical protein GX335_02010 [Firmicutes bacterium]|nr:hypothetical protein [Bacillota bacterium]
MGLFVQNRGTIVFNKNEVISFQTLRETSKGESREKTIALFLVVFLILLGGSGEVWSREVYGDRYPVEALNRYKPPQWRGFSFFGECLEDLNDKTRQKRLLYYENKYQAYPVFLIFAQDQTTLEKKLEEDKTLQGMLKAFWHESDVDIIELRDLRGEQNTLWTSSGHERQVFQSLFTNPPYGNPALF